MPLFGRKKKEPVKEIAPPKPIAPREERRELSAVDRLLQTIKEGPAKEQVVKKEPVQEIQQPVEIPEFPLPETTPSGDEFTKLDRTFEESMKLPELPAIHVKPEIKEEPKKPFAPLFVKIDRYRQILNAMNYLKNTLVMIKNTFAILDELEKLRTENLKLIEEAIDKVDKKLLTLDSEFLRPSGYMEEMVDLHEIQGIEATISDLKNQVRQLKSELNQLT